MESRWRQLLRLRVCVLYADVPLQEDQFNKSLSSTCIRNLIFRPRPSKHIYSALLRNLHLVCVRITESVPGPGEVLVGVFTALMGSGLRDADPGEQTQLSNRVVLLAAPCCWSATVETSVCSFSLCLEAKELTFDLRRSGLLCASSGLLPSPLGTVGRRGRPPQTRFPSRRQERDCISDLIEVIYGHEL